MNRLRLNLHQSNYPESMPSPPRNLDRTTDKDSEKLTTVYLLNVKCLTAKIQKICIRTIFRSGTILRKYLFRVKPPTEYNITKNWVYSFLCSCGKIGKGDTCRQLKVKLEEHGKTVCRGEIEKSGIADHI